jgi:hypothetical protein
LLVSKLLVELIDRHCNQLQLRLFMSAPKKLLPQSVWRHLEVRRWAVRVMETSPQQQVLQFSMD